MERPELSVKEWYVPSWRRKNRLVQLLHRLSGYCRIALIVLCAACAVLLALPPHNSTYAEPISFQIARGELIAWGEIISLATLLALCIPWLVTHRRLGSALVSAAGIVGLVLIASSDPLSSFHLDVFCYTCITLVAWLWGLVAFEGGAFYSIAASAASFGVLFCFANMGVGERIIIASAIAGSGGLLFDILSDY